MITVLMESPLGRKLDLCNQRRTEPLVVFMKKSGGIPVIGFKVGTSYVAGFGKIGVSMFRGGTVPEEPYFEVYEEREVEEI